MGSSKAGASLMADSMGSSKAGPNSADIQDILHNPFYS